jgi:nitrogenase molybdenum-iron protein alpha chain
MGMETIAAGYEFAHRDDYEGRRVLPTIKIDADSRNIEELHVDSRPGEVPSRRSRKFAESGPRDTVQGIRRHDAEMKDKT